MIAPRSPSRASPLSVRDGDRSDGDDRGGGGGGRGGGGGQHMEDGIMPTKKSNPQKRSTSKAKPSAKSAAAERVATRRGAPQPARVPGSEKQRSQGRFPGETPLTGEDRPANRPGGKQRGQASGGRGSGTGGRGGTATR